MATFNSIEPSNRQKKHKTYVKKSDSLKIPSIQKLQFPGISRNSNAFDKNVRSTKTLPAPWRRQFFTFAQDPLWAELLMSKKCWFTLSPLICFHESGDSGQSRKKFRRLLESNPRHFSHAATAFARPIPPGYLFGYLRTHEALLAPSCSAEPL